MTPEKKLTVVCMGDSVTEGFGLEDVTCTYPFLLQEFLEENYSVFNKGSSCGCTVQKSEDGTCILPYIHQDCYREALALCGDIYILMLGTDAVQETHGSLSPESEFEACYQAIAQEMKAALPESSIFIVTPFPVSPHPSNKPMERRLKHLLPRIAAIAASNQLPLIDLHSELSKLPEEELSAAYQDDGIHPNVQGTMLIAATLAYAIGNRIY